jgi:hypothetical protein
MRGMSNQAMSYVGVEPFGMRALGAALQEAEAAAGNAGRRLAVLLELAEECSTETALPDLAAQLGTARRDVRRRAEIAEDFVRALAVPECELPWHDPLRRAGLAVGRNAKNVGAGFVDSILSSAVTLWELRPFHAGSRQAWVELSAGAQMVRKHPKSGFYIFLPAQELEDRGFAYASGALVGGAIAAMFGGGGAAARTVKVLDDLSDAGTWAGRVRSSGLQGLKTGPVGRRPPAGPRGGRRRAPRRQGSKLAGAGGPGR